MKPVVFVSVLFAACASPDASNVIGTAKGPDLGNFVVSGDASSSTPADFATQSIDLGMSLDQSVESVPPDFAVAHDLSMPADMATSSGCGSVTYAGSCKNNTLTYCYQNAVQTLKCTDGTQCTTVSGDSDCRYVDGSACGSIDEDGLCDGDTLVYCDDSSNTLSVTDCSASGLSCDDSFGFADCD